MNLTNTRTIMKTISILILLALLAGCGAPATSAPAPTVDTSALRTEVAQTVVANPTIQTALNPPADTPTTPPTATQAAVVLAPTDTAVPPAATATTVVLQPAATITAVATKKPVAQPTVAKSDQALLMYAQPAAYTHFQPREPFDAVWTFKNVGMRTWTNEYFLTFDGGKDFVVKGDTAMISGKVHPGSTTQLVLDMVAPSAPGTYTARFSFYNDNRFIFGTFYIIIIVD